jgi:hypothetical protein
MITRIPVEKDDEAKSAPTPPVVIVIPVATTASDVLSMLAMHVASVAARKIPIP